MLKWFGGPKSDHPMADVKEVRRILTEVPGNDAFRALEELAHWLESVRGEEDFKPDHLAQVVQLIDEAAQLPARKLQRDYLSNTRLSRFQEQRLWQAIQTYWSQASLSYAACIDRVAGGGRGAEALKGALPLLCTRALRALAAQIKWQYVRYGPFDPAAWPTMARVYAFAETRGIASTPVAVYPGAGAEASAAQEFLRAVVLAASSPDSLLPAEIEITERLIAQLSGGFSIAPARQSDAVCWIDLASGGAGEGGGAGAAPQRLVRAPQAAATLRYVSAGGATQELEKLAQQIETSGSLPAQMKLGEDVSPAAVLAVLRHLGLYWAAKPPERRHPRHPVKSRLNVSGGFEGVCAALDPTSSLDFGDSRIENWIVEDVSAGGFRASIPLLRGEWVKLGSLVGLQPEGGDNWVVGVIRRLSRDTPQQGSVGIQSLARAAAAVRLRIQNAPTVGDEPAILLNPSPDAPEVQLLLKPGFHAAGQSYEFEFEGRAVMLMQVTALEQGEDYELIRARQMVRETGD